MAMAHNPIDSFSLHEAIINFKPKCNKCGRELNDFGFCPNIPCNIHDIGVSNVGYVQMKMEKRLNSNG